MAAKTVSPAIMLATKTARDSGWAVPASQVIVTNGGKQAVYQAFQVLLDPGDEVLLPAPYWTTYPEAIQLADGVPVEVFAGSDQGYKVTVDQLEAEVRAFRQDRAGHVALGMRLWKRPRLQEVFGRQKALRFADDPARAATLAQAEGRTTGASAAGGALWARSAFTAPG